MTRRVILLFISAALLGACSSTDDQATAPTTTSTASAELHLNDVQMIGTHNSYHVAPEEKLFAAEKEVAATLGPDAGGLGDIDSLGYTHEPLTDQLDAGIRSFELDVWADPVGGLFSKPLAPAFLQITDTPLPTGLDEPGFKVLHIVDIDFGSTCPTLIACLTEIRTWSDDHPDHLPIIINMELKDEGLPAPIDVTQVVPIDGAQMDALDAEIRSVFDDDRLLTPDDVRGDAATLRDAVTSEGWPLVDDVRGQVMLFLDNGGSHHTDYLAGHPSLEGRVLFTSAAADGDPDQAVVKINDPAEAERITRLVKDGFIVRTRADSDVSQAMANDTADREVTLASGAQIVSTDYPVSEPAPSGYVVSLGDGVQARCNAVIVDRCPTGALEP